MPLKDPRTRAGRWLVVPLVVLAGLVMVLAGVAMATVCLRTIEYPLRLAGEPGLLAVSGCVTEGSGKRAHTTCFGTFTPDSGAAAVPTSYDGSLSARARVPVQYVPSEDTTYRVGVAYTGVRVLGTCFGLFTVIAGGLGLAQAVRIAAPGRAARRREAFPGRAVGWVVAVLLVLTAASGLTSLVAYLMAYLLAD
ncbi:hypothetical protein PUR71_12145 [Streptomyces sp. SP17BM10]|uniref:hypothetical protein n=1 Tax=Streptomyces sp. SP17BM10 TaxID=3002530 RepID=UPI002E781FDD|nr:hypothetical protein [Streptomyces sp. SP17BM10]MEE1783651.1 hypothetical protein [Streptomyces sp. SP17BM10]